MKKIITLLVLLNSILIAPSYASHIKGGEITWQCLGSGQYVFQLKLYRDCNGIPLGSPQGIHSTVPGHLNISMNLIADNDLTPPGCGNSCNSPIAGSTEEFIFQSNPITLNGIPPAIGWAFYWDQECCRNNVQNILNPCNMVLRSIMYPFPFIGNANPCFDSSPAFNEKPISFICIGYPYSYNADGADKDHDSLKYSFDYPFDNCSTGGGLGAAMTFIPPYSVNSPLPGNPTIDPNTGELNMFPAAGTTQGNFALCTRVSAYKCGVKTADVFREIQISISASIMCDSAINSSGNITVNTPPVISPAPFPDPITGLYTSFTDTVNVGDTINFNINVIDSEMHLGGSPENFWFDMSGAEMDTGSVAPYGNCERPPCAYLSTITPAGPYAWGHQFVFTWIAACAQDTGICAGEYSTYYFVIKVKDDECPVPAINSKTVTIVVRGLQITQIGNVLSVNIPFTSIQWYLNGVAIVGGTHNNYVISIPGNYSVSVVSPWGCTLNSHVDNVAVGVNDLSSTDKFYLSPNPVSSILKITLPSTNKNGLLKVIDSEGRNLILKKVFAFNNTFDLDIKSLQNGIYDLTFQMEEKIYRQKFVVVK